VVTGGAEISRAARPSTATTEDDHAEPDSIPKGIDTQPPCALDESRRVMAEEEKRTPPAVQRIDELFALIEEDECARRAELARCVTRVRVRVARAAVGSALRASGRRTCRSQPEGSAFLRERQRAAIAARRRRVNAHPRGRTRGAPRRRDAASRRDVIGTIATGASAKSARTRTHG